MTGPRDLPDVAPLVPDVTVRAWQGFRRNPDTGDLETGTYTRVIPTADVLRALPYHSPAPGWHSHGVHLIPTDGCAACTELHRRADQTAAAGDLAQEAHP